MMTRVPLLDAFVVSIDHESDVELNQVVIVVDSYSFVIAVDAFTSQRS